MKRFLAFFTVATLWATALAAQDRVSADSPREAETCNLPIAATTFAISADRRLSHRESSDIVMSALAVRKAATAATGCREVRRAARKAFDMVWRTFTDRHEVSVSYGIYSVTGELGRTGINNNGGYSYEWNGDMYRYSGDRSTGSFNLGYMYRLSRRWSAGLTAGVSSVSGDLYKNGGKYVTDRTTTLYVTPSLRLNWIDRPRVKCYSELSIGYACDFYRYCGDKCARLNDTYFAMYTTFAGISVGRRLRGFAEFGAGFRGLVCVGIGYSLR